jgi:putative transcriptional regulator
MDKELFEGLKGSMEQAIAIAEGKAKPAKIYPVVIPDEVDVKAIRAKLKLSQQQFAATFGFSLTTVKHWEAQRRNPDRSARALLKIIDYSPSTALKALQS